MISFFLFFSIQTFYKTVHPHPHLILADIRWTYYCIPSTIFNLHIQTNIYKYNNPHPTVPYLQPVRWIHPDDLPKTKNRTRTSPKYTIYLHWTKQNKKNIRLIGNPIPSNIHHDSRFVFRQRHRRYETSNCIALWLLRAC